MKSDFFKLIPIAAISCTLTLVLSGCEKDEDDEQNSIVSNPGSGVTDADGNTYATIVLGNGQEWMAENLRTTRYRNGTELSLAETSQDWLQLSSTGTCMVYGGYVESLDDTVYNGFYNFRAIVGPESSPNGGVCPAGWHVPTEEEWDALADYLGGASMAGDKMKNQDFFTTGSNTSGFAAIPFGAIDGSTGYSADNGAAAYFYSSTYSTLSGAPTAYAVADGLSGIQKLFEAMNTDFRDHGFSIRCIKD